MSLVSQSVTFVTRNLNYKVPLYNHMKMHNRMYFTCPVSATCKHKTSSRAMHAEMLDMVIQTSVNLNVTIVTGTKPQHR